MTKVRRFTGLSLSRKDRAALQKMRAKGAMTGRRWRRIQALLLLDKGLSLRQTAAAVGGYPREMSRLAWRYLDRGLMVALGEEPRPGGKRLLDSPQEAAIVALVCGPAPEGRSRWTTALLAEEVVRRGISDRAGRETIRMVLKTHDLKPWREKNVVRTANRPGVRGLHGGRAAPVRTRLPTE
jgi:putative transposase